MIHMMEDGKEPVPSKQARSTWPLYRIDAQTLLLNTKNSGQQKHLSSLDAGKD